MTLAVEVAYAGPEGQWLVRLALDDGATVADAIVASGLAATVPSLVIEGGRVGIWSQPTTLAAKLIDGDRVEIYRALEADPKESRRRRAETQRRR